MMLPLKVMSLLVASDKLIKAGVCEERSCAGAVKGAGEIQAQLLILCDLGKSVRTMRVMNRDTSGFILFWHLLLLGFYSCAYSLKNIN